jgi:dihydropteroate synthase
MQGAPATMQARPQYEQIVDEVVAFLTDRTQAAIEAGIAASQIVWDPGFGFGKDFTHNMNLLKGLSTLTCHAPVLIGLSRKRMIAELLGDTSIDRTHASVMAAMLCVQKGARIVRTHDVAPTVHSLAVLAGAAQT